MEDSTRAIGFGFGRGMQNKRPHRHDTAGRHDAVDGIVLSNEALNVRVGKEPLQVRSGIDTQRPVVLTRMIEVHP